MNYNVHFGACKPAGSSAGGGIPAPGKHAVGGEDERQRLLEQKRRDEERLREEAAARERLIRKEAREEGRREAEQGFAAGREAILKAVEAALDEHRKLLSDLSPQLTGLAFDMAEKILEVPVRDTVLRERAGNRIAAVLDELGRSVEARVSLPAEDHDAIRNILGEKGLGNRITFRRNDGMKPGEFEVDTPAERIVMDFGKTLDDLRSSFPAGRTSSASSAHPYPDDQKPEPHGAGIPPEAGS